MKHMKKAVLLAAICCFALSGCGKSDKDAPEDTNQAEGTITVDENTEEVPVETEQEAADPNGPKSFLTGEPVDAAIASQRPVSCMIGNTTDAMPQYGTSNADVIYEVPVEGGLTRLMTIYQDYAELPTIMSVRSCRHYYAYFSNEFEAIYVHYGQAIYATEMLKNFDDLNGLDGDLADVTFFRDSSRKSPHNAYINGKSIIAGIEKRGYRTEHADTYKGNYLFADNEVTLDNGEDAAVVAPGYVVNKPWFEYDPETGLYNRFQYKAAHVDGANNEQLAFKNIIFQVCDYKVEPDGKYLDIKTAAQSGAGKYISNGKAIDITWSKEVEDGVTAYYDADGNQLAMNPGKTFVCIVLNDATDRIGIFASKEDFEASR